MKLPFVDEAEVPRAKIVLYDLSSASARSDPGKFDLELGWVVVPPEQRGHGLSRPLASLLVALAIMKGDLVMDSDGRLATTDPLGYNYEYDDDLEPTADRDPDS
jgi:hypothetical protein